MEEKHGKSKSVTARATSSIGDDDGSETDGSSSAEDEDDDGVLATQALDAEISATLGAIKSKDPRVYNPNISFYSKLSEDASLEEDQKKDKAMYLRDYHRINLLRGDGVINEDEDQHHILTYAQEQDNLKYSIIDEMHVAANGTQDVPRENDGDASDEEDTFFTAKGTGEEGSSRPPKVKPFGEPEDVAMADKDPESFLSNYMSSRAWVPTPRSRLVPFESDDEEDERRAEEFEHAFNFRFEDPATSNEKLISHARDTAAKYSVRREEPTGRRKAREVEREKKEMRARELEQEKARLRNLKIEENEGKLRKIKEAAGLRGRMSGRRTGSLFSTTRGILSGGRRRWSGGSGRHFTPRGMKVIKMIMFQRVASCGQRHCTNQSGATRLTSMTLFRTLMMRKPMSRRACYPPKLNRNMHRSVEKRTLTPAGSKLIPSFPPRFGHQTRKTVPECGTSAKRRPV